LTRSVESVSRRGLSGIVAMATGALISDPTGRLPLTAISVLDPGVDDPSGNQRQRKDNDPEDECFGAGDTDRARVTEDVLVDEKGYGERGLQRPSMGHDENLVEDLKTTDDAERDHQEDDRAKEGDRDAEQLTNRTGSINRRRLVNLLRNVLQRG